MWRDYKAFLFRGNLLEIAVAFILGVVFQAVVAAFTEGIVMAAIAAAFGEPNFDAVTAGPLQVGVFLTAAVNFLIVASVLFLVVQATARIRRREEQEAPAPDPEEVLLLREIRDALVRD